MKTKYLLAIVTAVLIAIPTTFLEGRSRISRSGGGSRSVSSRSSGSRSVSSRSSGSRSVSSRSSGPSRSMSSRSMGSSRSISSRSGIRSSRSSSRPSISSRSSRSSSPSISSRSVGSSRSYSPSRSRGSRPRLSSPSESRPSRLSMSRRSSSRPSSTSSRVVRSSPLSSRSLSSRSSSSVRGLYNYNGPHVIRNPRGMFRSPTERVHRRTTRIVGHSRQGHHGIRYHHYRGDRIRFHAHVSFGYPWYRYRYGYYHYYQPVVRIYGHSYYPTYYYDPYYYDYFSYPRVIRVVTPAPQVIVNQVGVSPSPTVTYTEAPLQQTAQEKLIDDLMRGSSEERKLGAMQLGQYKNISAVAALLDALINDGSDEVRAAAAKSLGAISDPASYEALLRASAVELLGSTKQEMDIAAERIRTTVGEENLYVSPKMPPMNQGDEKLGQYLEELRYGNAKVREEAADALEKYPGTQTVAALINILINDYNSQVREEAAESFQKIRDRMTLPFLKWAQLNDPDKEVRKDAEKAVKNIYNTIQ